ncbi:SusE domain-containing protein [Moheibacter sediminis]|uniref:SusE outer membrane protein n=1 Tax=Moheibacter sediminis TaxID=1434700 RepID=A0A1W2C8M5_9FLAO|nr:SusE domain-containing protein [Moheibacter sediminis]SMC81456.1 SusE outer membrane protein [Moheibacter sediminis]
MKIFNYILSFIFISGLITSCSDDDFTKTNLNDALKPSITSPSEGSSYELLQENAGNEAFTMEWEEADFGVNSPVKYDVQASSSEDFSETTNVITALTGTSTSLTVGRLNAVSLSSGLPFDVEGNLFIRVKAYLGVAGSSGFIYSEPISLNVTPYEPLIDLSTPWGMVGSAVPNGWEGPDVPFWKTDLNGIDDGKYVAYATLTDGDIKIRKDNSWDENYGGAAGTLVSNGDDIPMTAGTYKFNVDMNALTYEFEEYSWGIVGDATPNGWNGPDVQLQYNGATNTWDAEVEFTNGNIKFRFNNAWALSYGDTGADGTLESENGADIPVTAGNYLVSVDFTNLTYSITPL